jgi:endonuclease III
MHRCARQSGHARPFCPLPDGADFAGADRAELEALIRPTGFFRQKARFIQECCHRLLHVYGGEIPDNMSDLLTLTGVARKTANVVLGEIYGIAEGITVDTHIKRLSGRLGWSKAVPARKR